MNTGEQLPPAIQPVNPSGPREQDKIFLVFAYLIFPFPLLPLMTVKDSPFVTWHAKQGLLFGLASLAVLFFFSVVLFAFGGFCLGLCLAVPLMGLDLFAMVKALNGERWRIPVIADLADKF